VTLELGAAGAVVTFVWIVWLINAYNFMDGIDGIAGVQAVTAAAGWMAIAWFTGSGIAFWLAGGILFSTLGFLVHNWPPATIFMGDVGSAYLGFSFAVMPLLATIGDSSDVLLPVAAGLLVWFFIFDTVVTMVRRVLRRDKVWRAHREHFYQRLVRSGWPHAKVSLLYGILALAATVSVVYVFASPQAYMPAPLIVTCLATLVLLAVYIKSGRAKPSGTSDI
jgi:UDP-N-acetylmuramyl pentapeptide phosphotransferase/UDP-N-acetylglucosamine-1-phosphate transferase